MIAIETLLKHYYELLAILIISLAVFIVLVIFTFWWIAKLHSPPGRKTSKYLLTYLLIFRIRNFS